MAPDLDSARELKSGGAAGVVQRDSAPRRRAGAEAGRRLLCRACDEPVTADAERIAVAGAHRHRRSNPARHSFEFGCFRHAPGAVAAGVPTDEHCWFPGYRWSFSLCRGCAGQLGWQFEGPPPPFHGLILDRLRPEHGRGE